MRIYGLLAVVLLAGAFCRGAWITVDDDGPADFSSIQQAINYARNGDEIVVKEGVYREEVSFAGKAIIVRSRAPQKPEVVEATVIEAAGIYAVRFDFGEGAGSVLRGFTIRGGGIRCYGGAPTIEWNVIRDCAGVGIFCENGAAPVVQWNVIRDNGGRGIEGSAGPIRYNEIRGNAGGVSYCSGEIRANIISENTIVVPGYGGGLYQCSGAVLDNTIVNNRAAHSGGALYACSGEIAGNVIVANEAQFQGGGLWSCHGPIHHNIIAGNRSPSGGGLYGCLGFIYNNTIAGNRSGLGAAVYNCGVIYNNIIAFNEADEGGGIYGLGDSSYNVFYENRGGHFGGGAMAGPGDVVGDPRFVQAGFWDPNGTAEPDDDFWVDGDWHVKSQAGRWDPLSRRWVQDDVTGAGVDAGDPNSDWRQEFWPHGKLINTGAYGGTAQASMSLSDVGKRADLNLDEVVDYLDLELLAEHWLVKDTLVREDLDRDGIVDFRDFALLLEQWEPQLPVPEPPIPDPMTWAVEPYATSPTTIAMVATTATSTDGTDVEYYFECVDDPNFNSGWISFGPGEPAMWEDTGLDPGYTFSYRVKARNKGNRLETGWSQIRSARTPSDDVTPPSPDPMQWEVEPHEVWGGGGTFDYYASMVAAEATDDSGVVEYFFECTTDERFSSGWQTSPEYTVRVGHFKQGHRFRVKARDKYGNETGWSTELVAD